MVSIYDDLERVKLRPGMFLGGNSVTYLEKFLAGYQFAVKEERLYTEENIPFAFFRDYVADKYKISSNTGWCRIILQEAAGSEERGLELFFELLEKFKKIKITRVWSLELSEECVHYHLTAKEVPRVAKGNPDGTSEDFVPVFSDVKNIYKLELSNHSRLLVVQKKENSARMVLWDSLNGTKIEEQMKLCFGTVVWKESAERFEKLRLVHFERD